jgi:hypothetical protein
MILSILAILSAMYWLAIETDFLQCNLRGDNFIELQCNEHRKHTPQIEPCRIINASYPEDDDDDYSPKALQSIQSETSDNYKPSIFTMLELPETTIGNVNILCKRCE